MSTKACSSSSFNNNGPSQSSREILVQRNRKIGLEAKNLKEILSRLVKKLMKGTEIEELHLKRLKKFRSHLIRRATCCLQSWFRQRLIRTRFLELKKCRAQQMKLQTQLILLLGDKEAESSNASSSHSSAATTNLTTTRASHINNNSLLIFSLKHKIYTADYNWKQTQKLLKEENSKSFGPHQQGIAIFQALVRGHFVRKSFKQSSKISYLNNDEQKVFQEANLAVIIQTLCRRFLAKKSYELKKSKFAKLSKLPRLVRNFLKKICQDRSSVVIQALFRGFFAQKHYQQMKSNWAKLSKLPRLVRKFLKYIKQFRVAVVLQTIMRGVFARKSFKLMKPTTPSSQVALSIFSPGTRAALSKVNIKNIRKNFEN